MLGWHNCGIGNNAGVNDETTNEKILVWYDNAGYDGI